ncbi:MAG: hypothetical protein WC900_03190 [Oscillospiraceae bacterium]|jgi:hypothetical protein
MTSNSIASDIFSVDFDAVEEVLFRIESLIEALVKDNERLEDLIYSYSHCTCGGRDMHCHTNDVMNCSSCIHENNGDISELTSLKKGMEELANDAHATDLDLRKMICDMLGDDENEDFVLGGSMDGLFTDPEIMEYIFEQSLAYYKEGEIWKELVEKDGKSLDKYEYLILADIFLSLDTQGMEDFINLSLDFAGDYTSENIQEFQWTNKHKARSIFNVDKDKMNGLNSALDFILTLQQLNTDYNDSFSLNSFRENMEKSQIIKSLSQNDSFYDEIGSRNPITLTSGNGVDTNNTQSDTSYLIEYFQYNYYHRPRTWKIWNLEGGKIEISHVATGDANDCNSAKKVLEMISEKYGVSSLNIISSNITSYAWSTVYDKALEEFSEQASTTALKNLSDLLPAAGSLFSLWYDIETEIQEQKENLDFALKLTDVYNSGNCMGLFDLHSVYVTGEGIDSYIYMMPSDRTQKTIDYLNSFGCNFDMGKMLSDFQSQVDEYMKMESILPESKYDLVILNCSRGIWGEIK